MFLHKKSRSQNKDEAAFMKHWNALIQKQTAALNHFEQQCLSTDDIPVEQMCKRLIKQFRETRRVPGMLSAIAVELFTEDKYRPRAVRIMEYLQSAKEASSSDDISMYMLLAKYYIDNGHIDRGKHFLLLIPEACINYEESLQFRDLLNMWNTYKHLVEKEIPPSRNMQTEDTPDNEKNRSVLEEIELLLEEVCSGGFSHYLYYYGAYFNSAYAAVKEIGAVKTLQILENVKQKFPNATVPDSTDECAILVDELEDADIDFEQEDDLFYTVGEKELVALTGID